jgi:hypothetical protein
MMHNVLGTAVRQLELSKPSHCSLPFLRPSPHFGGPQLISTAARPT